MKFELRFPPEVLFGRGEAGKLGAIACGMGSRVLVVGGRKSLAASGARGMIEQDLDRHNLFSIWFEAAGEPEVGVVDEAVARAQEAECNLVVAIGGGSALDTGKAVAGLIPNEGSVKDYLEGVGTGAVMKRAPVPFIAVPTTAGTGSEATRNAVIAGRREGFKRSFRDPRLVPRAVIIDPDLAASCPREITAACGMDALTQLIESLVSLNATALTRSLSLSGISAAGKGLPGAFEAGESMEKRELMAYASFLSGVTLSHAGLGAVHGLAANIGGLFDVSHSVVCARLLAPVSRASISALEKGRGDSDALALYRQARDLLGEEIGAFCSRFSLPGLSRFGLKASDAGLILSDLDGGGFRTNPVELTREELSSCLAEAIG